LFYPAQFWPHKNHAVLLYALKCLKEKHILLDLVFVGQDKGNYSYIRRLSSKLGLDEQVHFCGFVPREDLIALYKNALCLTYPSFFGPENLPPLEAFALGCPVVASKVEGAKEQMGDAALLVEPNNEKAWAEAINKLLVEPELKEELIGAGKKRADEWRAVDFVDGIFDIIDECGSVRRCWGYNYQYLNT
jgi:glycosyltransferase involved in cell wall biosynthesis